MSSAFSAKDSFYVKPVLPFVMSAEESVDIDTWVDFHLHRHYLIKYLKQQVDGEDDNRKKTKTLNVMHVASFWGNIGDNANHTGMRKILSRYTGYHFRFKEVEIRDFYIMRKKRKFDDSFVREANRHDLLLIGGGNFFDLWINESATGTTIDMKKEIFEQIKVPVILGWAKILIKEHLRKPHPEISIRC